MAEKDEPTCEEIAHLPEDRQCFVQGMFGTYDACETIPIFKAGARETLIGDNRKVNAQIVLGVDRPKSVASGYGAKGNPHAPCGTIDLVVGRMGKKAKSVVVDNNFTVDAARIYISQKTDVDKNFRLKGGSVGQSVGKSAIALKADAVRLVARKGIKLVTGIDQRNSQDGENKSIAGIDLIAGNIAGMEEFLDPESQTTKFIKDLQPLVKGDNLTECLERIVAHIDSLNGVVDHLLTTVVNLTESLTHHFHHESHYVNAGMPSDSLAAKGTKCMIDFLQEDKGSLINHKFNLTNMMETYLHPQGQKNINSRWNNTN